MVGIVEAQCGNGFPCRRFRWVLPSLNHHYKSTHFGFAFGVNIPPSINPDLPR